MKRRTFRRLCGAVLVGSLAFTVAVPSAAAVPRGRFGVGDSIMLSAADELADFGFDRNAEVGRRFDAGVRVVRRLATNGKLPRHVVVHLGTNGPLAIEDCEELVGHARKRQVYLVNVRVPRWWEEDVNDTLRACAAGYDRVHLLNWWRKSGRHLDTWLANDGYHLTSDGQAGYAAWIDERVDRVVRALRSAR